MKFGGDTGIDADFEPYREMPQKVQKVFNRWHNRLNDVVHCVELNVRPNEQYEWMPVRDLVDLLTICKEMTDGNFNKANTLIRDLDTAARDEIPKTVYNWVS